jgi:hypothetical protein
MTIKQAKELVADMGMTLIVRDREIRVNYRGGREDTAYYTEDIHDAITSAEMMAEEAMYHARKCSWDAR